MGVYDEVGRGAGCRFQVAGYRVSSFRLQGKREMRKEKRGKGFPSHYSLFTSTYEVSSCRVQVAGKRAKEKRKGKRNNGKRFFPLTSHNSLLTIHHSPFSGYEQDHHKYITAARIRLRIFICAARK